MIDEGRSAMDGYGISSDALTAQPRPLSNDAMDAIGHVAAVISRRNPAFPVFRTSQIARSPPNSLLRLSSNPGAVPRGHFWLTSAG